MQTKFSLTFAKMVFNLEPILCHYDVKSNFITSLNAAALQSKWFLEEEMNSMEELLQIDDEKLSLLGLITVQNFIPETYSLGFTTDFLILEVEDQLMEILNVECGDSSIHISYCLQNLYIFSKSRDL